MSASSPCDKEQTLAIFEPSCEPRNEMSRARASNFDAFLHNARLRGVFLGNLLVNLGTNRE